MAEIGHEAQSTNDVSARVAFPRFVTSASCDVRLRLTLLVAACTRNCTLFEKLTFRIEEGPAVQAIAA